MADYIANFELKKNTLELQGKVCKNQLQANLIVNTNDKHFTYEQTAASDTWEVTHNLNKRPSITVVDSADNVVEGDYTYIDKNKVILRFNSAFVGKAYFN